MATGSRHFQTITVLRFTDDGTSLISGGDDNLVVVWNMSRCVCVCVCPSAFAHASMHMCVHHT